MRELVYLNSKITENRKSVFHQLFENFFANNIYFYA